MLVRQLQSCLSMPLKSVHDPEYINVAEVSLQPRTLALFRIARNLI